VTARGNRREPIFFEDGDREVYLDLLCEQLTKARVALWAYSHRAPPSGRSQLRLRKADLRLLARSRPPWGQTENRLLKIEADRGHVPMSVPFDEPETAFS
jgi:hypothetical protein